MLPSKFTWPGFASIIGAIVVLALLVAGVLFVQTNASAGGGEARMYMGISKVAPRDLHRILPDIKEKPAVLYFHSRLCLDCKKITPVLNRIMPGFAGLTLRKFDILEERERHPQVFEAFRPVSVPTIVLVQPNGKIQNVLYNYQSEADLREALSRLDRTAKTADRGKN